MLVLGAAAGGGLPQWNCTVGASGPLWSADKAHLHATQSSIAIGTDGHWTVVNASPDIREQIIRQPLLHPTSAPGDAPRRTPITRVILTNADLDHIAGLLSLRERTAFDLVATRTTLETLAANPVFNAVAAARRISVDIDTNFSLHGGCKARLFSVPGKTPLFLEPSGGTPEVGNRTEETVGLDVRSGDGKRLCYLPGCAAIDDEVRRQVHGSDVLLFDGTVFHDDELARAGVGEKTGRRMGHVPIAGADGSLAQLADVEVGRRIYIHINNTNPIWQPDGPERHEVERYGWEVAYDEMKISL